MWFVRRQKTDLALKQPPPKSHTVGMDEPHNPKAEVDSDESASESRSFVIPRHPGMPWSDVTAQRCQNGSERLLSATECRWTRTGCLVYGLPTAAQHTCITASDGCACKTHGSKGQTCGLSAFCTRARAHAGQGRCKGKGGGGCTTAGHEVEVQQEGGVLRRRRAEVRIDCAWPTAHDEMAGSGVLQADGNRQGPAPRGSSCPVRHRRRNQPFCRVV